MTHLPPLTAREVIRLLKTAGFAFDRQAKGSHEIWYNPETRRQCDRSQSSRTNHLQRHPDDDHPGERPLSRGVLLEPVTDRQRQRHHTRWEPFDRATPLPCLRMALCLNLETVPYPVSPPEVGSFTTEGGKEHQVRIIFTTTTTTPL